jgi:hypothetical protein
MVVVTEDDARFADTPADAPALGGTTIVTDGQDGWDAWNSSCEIECRMDIDVHCQIVTCIEV